jgi:hypothetical protein
MKERGMKKWAPYASLIEQKGTVVRMKEARNHQPKPLISQEQAQDINEVLTSCYRAEVKLTYFRSGQSFVITGVVEKIDYDQKYLHIDGQFIEFKEIILLTFHSPIK